MHEFNLLTLKCHFTNRVIYTTIIGLDCIETNMQAENNPILVRGCISPKYTKVFCTTNLDMVQDDLITKQFSPLKDQIRCQQLKRTLIVRKYKEIDQRIRVRNSKP